MPGCALAQLSVLQALESRPLLAVRALMGSHGRVLAKLGTYRQPSLVGRCGNLFKQDLRGPEKKRKTSSVSPAPPCVRHRRKLWHLLPRMLLHRPTAPTSLRQRSLPAGRTPVSGRPLCPRQHAQAATRPVHLGELPVGLASLIKRCKRPRAAALTGTSCA